MKATDLMIGDWVYNHRNWECPILSIRRDYDSEQYYAMVIARHYGEEEFKVEDLSPIPLTAEILEKSGFEFDTADTGILDYYCIGNKGDEICTVVKKHSINAFEDGTVVQWSLYADRASVVEKITYVHELQHALRLCQIDKEIVL